MKVDYKTIQKRRDDIMMLIQKFGSITVEQLQNEFKVSAITLRRDLQYWEDRDAIIRYHGGAKIIQHMVNHDNTAFTNDRYKHAIAKYAASTVDENDTIFINSSSTALLMLEYLNKRCTVVTNNAKATFAKHADCVTIILTGGELRFPKETMVGDFCLNNINKIIANKCYLGCSGIQVNTGVTSAISNETQVNEAMIRNTKNQVYVLCDYTKVGNKHSFIYADIQKINYLVTDINASENDCYEIENQGVKVVRLEPIAVIRK